jgi:hypothetical protein
MADSSADVCRNRRAALAGIFLHICGLIIALMIIAFLVPEALWDVSYATTARTVTHIEQHVHSGFVESFQLRRSGAAMGAIHGPIALNSSLGEGVRLKAKRPCRFRIIWTILTPARVTVAVAIALKPSIGRTAAWCDDDLARWDCSRAL